MAYVVEFEGVSFEYTSDGFCLDGITFSIPKGIRLAISGPNGAGKTTLLKMIVGLITPSEGKIKVFGKELSKRTIQEIRRKVGFVFQNPDDQIFATTVYEDVAFGPRNLGFSENEVHETVTSALQQAGMEGYAYSSPYELSFGQKKKVAIAGVLAMSPELLILDEPFANLDLPSTISLLKFLNRVIVEKGITIIFSTHNHQLIRAWGEKLIVLNHGKTIFNGPPNVGLNTVEVIDALGNPSDLEKLLI